MLGLEESKLDSLETWCRILKKHGCDDEATSRWCSLYLSGDSGKKHALGIVHKMMETSLRKPSAFVVSCVRKAWLQEHEPERRRS